MTADMIAAEDVTPGTVVLGGPDNVPCDVLSVSAGTETVAPLAGRPRVELWAMRQDTGQVGMIPLGPGGVLPLAVTGGPMVPAVWLPQPPRWADPADIFTPTPRQRATSAHTRWLSANCPTASAVGVRAVTRQRRGVS